MVQIKVYATLCAGKRHQSVRIMLFKIANAGTFTTRNKGCLKTSEYQNVAQLRTFANIRIEFSECNHVQKRMSF